ncbi:MAG: glycoside hydrolase family 3 C-terminal domain-containing protein [Saprospiraceae bacterium]|nr:glycoside hydrolase family 3 C-terminal domain-containing protein [Saprospiraceae bacterium]MBK8372445.1 glycoside hydrolase family 3 C-terminal domain-containing protein [Saprospiraceae bacterium]MBK8547999.1 glycoside hydrolase family 3 C-terminal domain-containing protein [Saprospiraceae bacterium]
MKQYIIYLLTLTLIFQLSCAKKMGETSAKVKKDPFIEDLLKKMTLDEKLGQMSLFTTDWESTGPTIRAGYQNDIRSGRCGALFNSHTVDFTTKLQKIAVEESRLKIPLLFGYDVIHGYKTMFPIPLGEAASWDLFAIENSAYIMSKEGAAAGLHWTFAPMVDISRDPRWGRVLEGSGEDPFLGSRIAEARVRGIQGKQTGQTDRLLACVKHFAAYGAPNAGRDYNPAEISERVFREVYLPTYASAVKAGAKTVMTSFNDYDGVPASGNKYLLTDILRKELGFDGFVVTDYTSINEMVKHGVVKDETDAGILAIQAGVDMDMQGGVFQEKIKDGINDGRIKEEQINQSVRTILKIKKDLGLFEDPFKYSSKERESNTILSKAHLEASHDMAKRSIVLLKNDNTLPLKDKTTKILVTGPLADDKNNLIGAWSASGEGRHCVSMYEGLRAHENSKRCTFEYIKGCNVDDKDKSQFEIVLEAAKKADVIILAIGENKDMSGEATSRTMIRIPGVQEELLLALKAIGKPIITVVMNGRPLVLDKVHDHSNAVLETWWLGTQAGHAIAEVIYGVYNPSGKLPMTFPRNEGQIPIFYNEKNTGRPFNPNDKYSSKYIDIPNTPLYPFGYGLSYTSFTFGPPLSNKKLYSLKENVVVTVEIQNTGNYPGEEVVQLYIRDLVSSVTRPVKELKGFQKVFLKKGEKKTLSFTLTPNDLSFYNKNMEWVIEPGDFEIFIGGDSDTQNKVKITIL